MGEQRLRPLVEWGEPWLTAVESMPYVAVQSMLDPGHWWGIREYSKSDYLPQLTDDAIDALVGKVAQSRSPFSGVHLCNIGGAVTRADRSAMALQIPQTNWYYMCEALWTDSEHADSEIEWARSLQRTMRPWSVDKAPPNFISGDEGHLRLRASYGEEKFARLVGLMDRYDPTNVFALNQNIPPSRGEKL